MKRTSFAAILVLALVTSTASPAAAQQSLSATLEVFVFPAEGQTASEQSIHEAECYQWAVNNTGTDPFDLMRQAQEQSGQAAAAQQQASQVGTGAGAAGAVSGAATGALIGAIAGDAGRGAAWGAGLGAVSGRSRGRAARRGAETQAAQQAEQQAQATEQQMDNFRRAFTVCLEAKGYMVR